LLDGLGSHHTHEFLQTCAGQGIDVPFLVPHSSDQTQRLDVLTFALMKRHFSGSRFSRLENPQSNRLVRILGAWSESNAPHHNIEPFLRIGLVPFDEILRSGEDDWRVQSEAARWVRRWRGLDEGCDRTPFPPEGRRRMHLPIGQQTFTNLFMMAGMMRIGEGKELSKARRNRFDERSTASWDRGRSNLKSGLVIWPRWSDRDGREFCVRKSSWPEMEHAAGRGLRWTGIPSCCFDPAPRGRETRIRGRVGAVSWRSWETILLFAGP
jgi:hypothetical protein